MGNAEGWLCSQLQQAALNIGGIRQHDSPDGPFSSLHLRGLRLEQCNLGRKQIWASLRGQLDSIESSQVETA
jgi:hypothetical protein